MQTLNKSEPECAGIAHSKQAAVPVFIKGQVFNLVWVQCFVFFDLSSEIRTDVFCFSCILLV